MWLFAARQSPALPLQLKIYIYWFLWVPRAQRLAPTISIDPWPRPRLRHPLLEQGGGMVAPGGCWQALSTIDCLWSLRAGPWWGFAFGQIGVMGY